MALSQEFGPTATKSQLKDWGARDGKTYPRWITKEEWRVIKRGVYSLATEREDAPFDTAVAAPTVADISSLVVASGETATRDETCFIPERDPNFEPFGFFDDLVSIIDRKIFFPVYITGLSGNGKTLGCIEACARKKRELVRVNINKDTDELDLFGSYDLINGNTVRREGPVITAMRKGAVLLLDETDYGSERLLCLQPILEGKPYLDKKTNKMVHPTPGFNVLACANTKGKGSSDGRFVGANILNEAFLERFAITVEQEYPPEHIESKILGKHFKSLNLLSPEDTDFANNLIKWTTTVRKSYEERAVDEIISTRRLVHIARAYAIFGNRKSALTYCLNRFDDVTKKAFVDLYQMIDKSYDEKRGERQSKKVPAPTPMVQTPPGAPFSSSVPPGGHVTKPAAPVGKTGVARQQATLDPQICQAIGADLAQKFSNRITVEKRGDKLRVTYVKGGATCHVDHDLASLPSGSSDVYSFLVRTLSQELPITKS